MSSGSGGGGASNVFPPHIAALRARLTTGRFDPYMIETGQDPYAALRLYEWNTQIASAFQETLGQLEILLRNALDEQLQKYVHQRLLLRGSWFNHPPFNKQHKGRITRAKDFATRNGIPEVHGKVLAELDFGIWVDLLESNTLWPTALRHAFPHLRPRVRSEIHDRVKRMRDLRNRIAHHERIFDRDLRDDWRVVIELAGYIDPITATWIWSTSRVESVLAARP